jgi:hypothetical protein
MYYLQIDDGEVTVSRVRIGFIGDSGHIRSWFVDARTPAGDRIAYGEFQLHKLDSVHRIVATAMAIVTRQHDLAN